ncbi:MAG TPA: cytochrome P450 [Acidimicrobiales bacterium]|nr:cytochrome P450 [Acidimicrobiales bacterium]
MEPNHVLAPDEIDLSDLAFWARPLDERDAAFEALRLHRPVAHFEDPEPPPGVSFPIPLDGSGYWAVSRHADIVEASRDPERFCSGQGATSIFDMPTEFLEFFGSMINLDDPRHARLRRIVSAAFTPRMVKQIGDDVQRSASLIVDDVIDRGKCDFVTDVAARLPLRIICNMMGVPERDHDLVFRQSNVILGGMDPEYVPEGADVTMALITAAQELTQLMEELGRHRTEHPADDITTALVTANVDGEQLTHQELASFFILLVVAGNETTRNAISHGLRLLTDHPDQRAAWAADFDALAPTAVEEIVRVASPVIFMRRTATEDTTLGGVDVPEGAKLLLFYWSANRDDAVFADPYRFDIRRDPNPHVGFGGPGPHFCLGAHLARQEITVMFRELLARVPDIHATGEPERLLSNFINGIKHLPVAVA